MRCRKVRSSLSTYCSGELPEDKANRVMKHLEGCASCRREEEAVRSVKKLVMDTSKMTVSEDFSARLFERITRERFAERKTKAYFPGRIPIFGAARLTATAAVTMGILVLAVALNFSNMLGPTSPQFARIINPVTNTGGEDLYLTAQPTDNPLLNKHKSVSEMVEQYGRWRGYSQALRSYQSPEQFLGGSGNVLAASSRSGSLSNIPNVHVRPVVKDYLIMPDNQSSGARRTVY